jgi:HEAT repeat protein
MAGKDLAPAKPDALGKLFDQLGTKTSDKAVASLIAIGMPAIERLVDGSEQGRPVRPSADASGRDFVDEISHLTHEVARTHPGEFLEYVLARPSHPGVRAMIGALGATRDARALPILIESSRDRDPDTRHMAVLALRDLGDAQATPALLARIKDRYDLASWAAIETLGVCGDARALPALEKMAGNKKSKCRGDATGAADAIRRRLGMASIPRKLGRALTVSLDESHLSKKERIGRSFRVCAKVGDKVVKGERLASVVSNRDEFELGAPFAGEVVEVVETRDAVSVTVRQFVADDG